ncbi:ISAs1 family transposase [Actinocatenispora thailandica]|uniref:ISAs1 family transposase n=1 Tax=Actinocatenispora thailandica TaxID=227318 RepID=UPI0023B2EBB2|nr:ISAs1 family transposase [Actinocatenispora thailandica]
MVTAGAEGLALAANAWSRLEQVADPRSRRGRVYPLECLLAMVLCALTAAGHDRLSAVGQWLARPAKPIWPGYGHPTTRPPAATGRPRKKMVRVLLDRLDPAALTAALLASASDPTPAAGSNASSPSRAASRSVRAYPARRRDRQAQQAARRLPAVAVDGKSCRGARGGDGRRVHLLGLAEHGGGLLDQVEVGAKRNETGHFRPLLQGKDLTGVVVTFDALHTVRSNLDWLVDNKKAHYVAVVKRNQPLLHARLAGLPWSRVATGHIIRESGHGRDETRSLKTVSCDQLDFPHAQQAVKIIRWRRDQTTGRVCRETVYAVTSLATTAATPADLARLAREHWHIEAHHHIRDVSFGEDGSTSRTSHGPVNLATLRAAVIAAIRRAGYLHVPESRRDHTTPAEAIRLHHLD